MSLIRRVIHLYSVDHSPSSAPAKYKIGFIRPQICIPSSGDVGHTCTCTANTGPQFPFWMLYDIMHILSHVHVTKSSVRLAKVIIPNTPFSQQLWTVSPLHFLTTIERCVCIERNVTDYFTLKNERSQAVSLHQKKCLPIATLWRMRSLDNFSIATPFLQPLSKWIGAMWGPITTRVQRETKFRPYCE